jgi:hypothetical protein
VLLLVGALVRSLTGAALLSAQQLSAVVPVASHSDVSVAFRFGAVIGQPMISLTATGAASNLAANLQAQAKRT